LYLLHGSEFTSIQIAPFTPTLISPLHCCFFNTSPSAWHGAYLDQCNAFPLGMVGIGWAPVCCFRHSRPCTVPHTTTNGVHTGQSFFLSFFTLAKKNEPEHIPNRCLVHQLTQQYHTFHISSQWYCRMRGTGIYSESKGCAFILNAPSLIHTPCRLF
jgi:hypothetical protein